MDFRVVLTLIRQARPLQSRSPGAISTNLGGSVKKIFLILPLLALSWKAQAGKAYACGTTDKVEIYYGLGSTMASAKAKAAAECRTKSEDFRLCRIYLCQPYTWPDAPRQRGSAVDQVMREQRQQNARIRRPANPMTGLDAVIERNRQDKLDQIIKEYDERRR